eukprot:SAG25_NODE_14425_length_255_cov_0.660256_1_plen_31_part_01
MPPSPSSPRPPPLVEQLAQVAHQLHVGAKLL